MAPELGFWTTQEIADALDRSQRFVSDSIRGRSAYALAATKFGHNYLVADEEAKRFIAQVQAGDKGYFTPNQLAKAIGKSRRFIWDQLTGYDGKYPPSLIGTKQGIHWIISKEEAERFIALHRDTAD
jgi:hypothetical protein